MAKKQIDLAVSQRTIYFIIGMVILSFLMIYSIKWELLPQITLTGMNITKYVYPPFLILFGALGSSFLTSAIIGYKRIDS